MKNIIELAIPVIVSVIFAIILSRFLVRRIVKFAGCCVDLIPPEGIDKKQWQLKLIIC